MAIIFENALSKDISAGNFAPTYLLFGNDSYIKKHYCERISARAYGGDPFFNLQKFNGDVDLQNVYDAVNQFPMMSDRKCVILSDYDFENASKEDFDKLCLLISNSCDSCVFILMFDTVAFDQKSYRAKKLIGCTDKCGGKAARLDHRRIPELVKMLVDGAKKRECRFSESAAKYLIESVGEDISLLKNELDKLCSYSSDGIIEKDLVDFVCVKSVEASVYDLVNEVFKCNISDAINLLDNMFFMHIEPMIILHTVSSAFVDISRMFAAAKSGASADDIDNMFEYKNRAFVLQHAYARVKKMDAARIDLCLQTLIDTDKSLKESAADSKTILEQLIIKLVYIIVKGESVDKTSSGCSC